MLLRAFDLYKRKCAQCGKHFEGCKEWAYKIEKVTDRYWYFCTWKCLREFEKRGVKKDGRKKGA